MEDIHGDEVKLEWSGVSSPFTQTIIPLKVDRWKGREDLTAINVYDEPRWKSSGKIPRP